MRLLFTPHTTARLFFIIGLLFMLLGCAFLLGSMANISRFSVLISFFFIVLGVGCAVLAIKFKKSSLYLFFAAYSFQVGLFLFLSSLNIIPAPFSRVWPLLSVFSGIALIPAGWHRYGNVRIRYIVPSLAFIILGSILLVFSLDLVSFSLAQFVKDWWPLLILLWGLIFMLVSLGTRNAGDKQSDF
jgi:hypothetical protein